MEVFIIKITHNEGLLVETSYHYQGSIQEHVFRGEDGKEKVRPTQGPGLPPRKMLVCPVIY